MGAPPLLFDTYKPLTGSFDEMIDVDGKPRPHARRATRILDGLSPKEFANAQSLAELSLYSQGVTFSVYSDQRGTEKIFPICLVPRVISGAEWTRVEKGLAQRIAALNAFLDDMYGAQTVLKAKNIPSDLILGAKFFLPKLRGIRPAGKVRIPIAGIDLIRSPDGVFRVLEDNLRTPSGVSYVVENRLVTKRIFQSAIEESAVRPVEQYPMHLAETLRAISPVDPEDTRMVLLTPGSFNSAYFEHTFLARTMGVELVEPSDLFVEDDIVFVRTIRGPERVHVVYRRIDDAYLDPGVLPARQHARRPRADAGVRGGQRRAGERARQRRGRRQGRVPVRPGSSIKHYLGEEAILAQVDTYVCARPDDLTYVLENLGRLVVKAVDEAGRLRHADGTAGQRRRARGLPPPHPRRAAPLHRPASGRAVDLPDLGSGHREAVARAGSTCGRSS